MLHVTNGDSAAGTIAQTGVEGEVLPWRDVLHDGPVPEGLPLEQLSAVRARFIAGCFEEDAAGSRADFAARDARLRATKAHDVTLWFEADLYDQLQLIQLLDWFRDNPSRSLALICIGEHPDIPRFAGLGQLNAVQMAALFPTRRSISPNQLELASKAWLAFRSANPEALGRLLQQETGALPFLRAALIRLLEEYPSLDSGLSRSEYQILAAIAAGAGTFGEVFAATQEMEERPFMGDRSLWVRIQDLAREPNPALRTGGNSTMPGDEPDWIGAPLTLMPSGQAYLGKAADFVREHGIDRWIGGVQLSGREVAWRWDRDRLAIVSAAKS